MGAISAVWTIGLLVVNPAQSVLGDSITALGFLIAFYYGLTGLACAVYYRHRLPRGGWRRWSATASLPLLGAVLLAGIFVKALHPLLAAHDRRCAGQLRRAGGRDRGADPDRDRLAGARPAR